MGKGRECGVRQQGRGGAGRMQVGGTGRWSWEAGRQEMVRGVSKKVDFKKKE